MRLRIAWRKVSFDERRSYELMKLTDVFFTQVFGGGLHGTVGAAPGPK